MSEHSAGSVDSSSGRHVRQLGSVAVAMSGGVDSSVAAALLVEGGYDVIGIMMRLWSEPGTGRQSPHNRCCTPDQMADARRVARKLKIPFYVLDVQDYFYKQIVRYFIDEHSRGMTPNPCIECNRVIRFDFLYRHALSLGADYLATGHYARVQHEPDGYHLFEAVDKQKDQSYVLHVLGQDQLARVRFPIGTYRKQEVRQLAEHYNLPVARKSESMDLCFLNDGDYRRFLRDNAEELSKPGPITNQKGDVIGQHTGLRNFTIGQRKGLGVALGYPVYVQRKDVVGNALVVSDEDGLLKNSLRCTEVNWISDTIPGDPISGEVKIRYRASAMPATIFPVGSGEAKVEFKQPVFGITPGQGAVFYQDEECLGGGIICDEDCQ